MLSKVGQRPVRLVCTNCGSPAPLVHTGPLLDPLISSLLLLGMGGFSVLLFFLTNPGQLETKQSRERASIPRLPSGALIHHPAPGAGPLPARPERA